MANFPSNLDSYTANVDNVDIIYASDVNGLQEAVVALEAKVGVNSSAVNTTHDYKLGEVTSTDKAVGKTATQTLTNKTLTNPVINVGSDATGDIYYRNAGVLTRLPIGTDNHILKINGTVPNWEAETSTVNGSTTVAGIFESATSAEVTAGTATGGTGAALAVTPDALAASTPVFNGSGLTNIPKLLNTVTTDVTYSSSTAENTLLSYSVAGGTLSTSNVVRVTMHVTALAITNTNTWTLRLKYGATTIATKVYTASGGAISGAQGKMEFLLVGAGTTSSQNGSYALNLGQTGYSTANGLVGQIFAESGQGTASEDSTAAKTLAITSQHNASSASDNITVSIIITEVIR